MTGYQWLVLFIAWLGWVFDAMDATIYAIVLHPALHELLAAGTPTGTVPAEHIGWYGGIIFSVFLIGWAIGGIFFGMLADYFGRTKTLIADHFDLCPLYRPCRAGPGLVASGHLPISHGAGHWRGVGSRRRDRGGNMAGG